MKSLLHLFHRGGESNKSFLFFNDRHRPRPTRRGAFDLDRKTAYGKPIWSSDGRQVGHFFHMTVADVNTGEVRLPDNFGITIFLEFFSLKRQGTVPAPGIDADDFYTFFSQKQGAFPLHPGAFHQVLLSTPGCIRTGLDQPLLPIEPEKRASMVY